MIADIFVSNNFQFKKETHHTSHTTQMSNSSKKRRTSDAHEWKVGEKAYIVAYICSDNELNIFTVPVRDMNPLLVHAHSESGANKFMLNLDDEDTLDPIFESLTKRKFESIISDSCEAEEEGEEDEEDEVEDRGEVVDYIREWVVGIPNKFHCPPPVQIHILGTFGICEEL